MRWCWRREHDPIFEPRILYTVKSPTDSPLELECLLPAADGDACRMPSLSVLLGTARDAPHTRLHAGLWLEIPSQRSKLPHHKSMGLYSKLNGGDWKAFLKARGNDFHWCIQNHRGQEQNRRTSGCGYSGSAEVTPGTRVMKWKLRKVDKTQDTRRGRVDRNLVTNWIVKERKASKNNIFDVMMRWHSTILDMRWQKIQSTRIPHWFVKLYTTTEKKVLRKDSRVKHLVRQYVGFILENCIQRNR